MTGDPRTRASDEDRERTAAALGTHYAAGRLTAEEFSERLDKAYAAKTLGELDGLMTDLPQADLGRLPAGSLPRADLGRLPADALPRADLGRLPSGGVPPPECRVGGQVPVRGGRPAVPRFWLTVAICAFVIWLISGASGSLWFLWLAIPLAVIMVRRAIVGGTRGNRRDR